MSQDTKNVYEERVESHLEAAVRLLETDLEASYSRVWNSVKAGEMALEDFQEYMAHAKVRHFNLVRNPPRY